MGEVLALPCPGCGSAYGEHTLVSLAECVEGLFLDPDADDARELCFDVGQPEVVRLFDDVLALVPDNRWQPTVRGNGDASGRLSVTGRSLGGPRPYETVRSATVTELFGGRQ